jgi:hypothetical protein
LALYNQLCFQGRELQILSFEWIFQIDRSKKFLIGYKKVNFWMVLMYKVLAFVIFQIFPLTIIANNSIPDQLFGINLGKHKEINASNLNVKKIESCMRSLSFMGFPLGASRELGY